jgi:hypothetical protein
MASLPGIGWPRKKGSAPHGVLTGATWLFFASLWIGLTPSHLFFIHDNIMHFLALGVGTVKCNRPRLSIA